MWIKTARVEIKENRYVFKNEHMVGILLVLFALLLFYFILSNTLQKPQHIIKICDSQMFSKYKNHLKYLLKAQAPEPIPKTSGKILLIQGQWVPNGACVSGSPNPLRTVQNDIGQRDHGEWG